MRHDKINTIVSIAEGVHENRRIKNGNYWFATNDSKAIFLNNVFDYTTSRVFENTESSFFLLFQRTGTSRWSCGNKYQLLQENEHICFNDEWKTFKIDLYQKSSCVIIKVHCALKQYAMQMSSIIYGVENYQHAFPITPAMEECLFEITTIHSKNEQTQTNFELSVLKLMLLQLEQYKDHDCRIFCHVHKEHRIKIERARSLLISNLAMWWTSAELANRVGTNQTSLKKGFKEVYGLPIFEFIKELKMREAKRLLLETRLLIGDIAEKLGYKNTTHFSAAFKKKFGKSPTESRKNPRVR